MQCLDTISAIATAVGEGGIGIIRISGERALEVAQKVFVCADKQKLSAAENRRVLYGHIIDDDGQVIDEALAIVMRAPKSYTREDVVELHCHGGVLPLRKTLSLTFKAGARPAERGEFTKRAFLNGRIDLTQAQAVMDMVRAKTDGSRKIAAAALTGKTAAKIENIRREVLSLIAHLEALIDFPEDDVDGLSLPLTRQKIERLIAEIDRLLATSRTGKILRDGLTTAIVGKPNVGKSSLLNALLNEERAIVTDIPGTTRDSIAEYMEVGGIPLKIIDTAGIRETATDRAEKIGIERAKAHIDDADLVLAVFDASRPLSDEDEQIIALTTDKEVIAVLNKSDLPPQISPADLSAKMPQATTIKTALKTADGETDLTELTAAITKKSGALDFLPDDGAVISAERQENLLRQARENLTASLNTLNMNLGEDFIVIDLRAAWENLGCITGQTVTEDIIDAIFAEFCIGK